MEIFYKEQVKEIEKIVLKHAKYQKVMLLYDDSVSMIKINEIFSYIKPFCVFNKLEITENLDEVYNGYKMLIFMCGGDSFLKCDINLDEFINVFIPTDRALLPYYLNSNKQICNRENYIFLDKIKIDENVIPSILFNKFYDYLYDLIFTQNSCVNFDFSKNEITTFQNLQIIDANKGLKISDIEILKQSNLSYSNLGLLDYLIITAFEIVINSIREQSLSLVDVYKISKDNNQYVDKLYAMFSNNPFQIIVALNYNSINTVLVQTKNQILNYLSFYQDENLEEILEKLKNYAKTSDGLIAYLYLYNVFGC